MYSNRYRMASRCGLQLHFFTNNNVGALYSFTIYMYVCIHIHHLKRSYCLNHLCMFIDHFYIKLWECSTLNATPFPERWFASKFSPSLPCLCIPLTVLLKKRSLRVDEHLLMDHVLGAESKKPLPISRSLSVLRSPKISTIVSFT